MLTCKAVATTIAQDESGRGGWQRTVTLRFHLLLCRHCRRYADQIQAIGPAVRRLLREHGDDSKAVARLEAAILGDLTAKSDTSDIEP